MGLCLSSRFPMMVLWGQDLIGIYNDGLRPVLGRVKHPDGLGAPAKEVWSEIWDLIGLLFRASARPARPPGQRTSALCSNAAGSQKSATSRIPRPRFVTQ